MSPMSENTNKQASPASEGPETAQAQGADTAETSSESPTGGRENPGEGSSAEHAESEIATPEDELEAARREASENYERFIRAKADLENIVKRHQREMSDRARYDGEALARDILSSIDDLERALQHVDEGTEAVSGGVELVLKGLLAALQRNGVERIEAEGKLFDPSEHEAVTMVETSDAPPNTVIEVFRAGYKIRDRLLRAAMVSVSKAVEEEKT